jgi:hypothetical protein
MRRHLRWILGLSVGCGDVPNPAPAGTDSDGESSSEGSGTSGSGGADDAIDSDPVPGPTSGGDGSTSGDAGTETDADGSSSGEPSTGEPPPLVCGPSEGRLVGDVGGQPVDETFAGGGAAIAAVGVMLLLGEAGRVYMRAPGEDLGRTGSVSGWGHVVIPGSGDAPDRWACFDAASTFASDGEDVFSASLGHVALLGSCPGTPVDGGVAIDWGEGASEPEVVSTIEGAAFEAPVGFEFGVVDLETGDFTAELDLGFVVEGRPATEGGVVRIHAAGVGGLEPGEHTVELDTGYLVVPTTEADGGAVYCLGAGSTLDVVVTEFEVWPAAAHIEGVSRLGACGPDSRGDGQLDACVNLAFR